MAYRMMEDAETDCILVRWTGRFDIEDVRAFFADIHRSEYYHACRPTFHDARAWDLDVPTGEVLRIAHDPQLPPRGGRPRRAATLVSSTLAFGMLRVLTGLREGPLLEFEIFYDLEAAKRWLDIAQVPGDPFARLMSS